MFYRHRSGYQDRTKTVNMVQTHLMYAWYSTVQRISRVVTKQVQKKKIQELHKLYNTYLQIAKIEQLYKHTP